MVVYIISQVVFLTWFLTQFGNMVVSVILPLRTKSFVGWIFELSIYSMYVIRYIAPMDYGDSRKLAWNV